jgi:hypothetical protein
MGLQDFARSTEVADGAELLSQRLLQPTVQMRRRYEASSEEIFNYYGPTISSPAREPTEPISDVVLIPYSFYVGFYGAGVMIWEDKEYPTVFCNERLAPSKPTLLQELQGRTELKRIILEIFGDNLPSSTVAFGLRSPIPHFGPSSAVKCSGKQGTLGAVVTTDTGAVGILTAGHVGAPLSADAISNSSTIGTVTYTTDPAYKPSATLSADVAVITINQSSIRFLSPSIKIRGVAKAGSTDRIESHCVNGRHAEGIFAKAPWIFVPQMAGLWGEVYMTQAPISVAGDSGAPVFLQGTEMIVGHVVGGSPGMTTYVQDIDYQLADCGCVLRIQP